jgi:hypothetical protein
LTPSRPRTRTVKRTVKRMIAVPVEAMPEPVHLEISTPQLPVAELTETVDMSSDFLSAPDNAALAAFAREQLPMLRSQVKDAKRTMADK